MLTADRARELLRYDPETGTFYWRTRRAGNAQAGRKTGYVNADGYVVIKVDGIVHSAHRLAWLVVFGEWPAHQIDHINGQRADNRIANLRSVTHAQNAQNRRLSKANRSGVAGVHWFARDGKWMARIYVNGKRRMLGLFDTVEQAATARRAAELQFLTHAPVGAQP